MENFELTPEEQEKGQYEAIAIAFMDVRPVEEPKGIFVLAQPGAGKTGLTGFIKLEFDNKYGQSMLHVDPDKIGLSHPHYTEIMQNSSQQTYAILQRFTNPTTKTINAMAIDRGVNILTEGTFRDKNGYLANIQKMIESGYSIEINLMAVDSLESMLSTMERYYYHMVELGLPPRNVEKKWHDLAYTGMLETLQEVEDRGMFDRIRIFTRGKEERHPNLIFSKSRDDRGISAVETLKLARQAERRRLLQNPENFRERIARLKETIVRNGNNPEQMAQLLAIEKDFEQAMLTSEAIEER